MFVGIVIHCIYFSKVRAPSRVWEGARGLEWTLPSPPPYHRSIRRRCWTA